MRRTPDSVLSRTAAAILGGYMVASFVGAALVAVLPIPKIDAVLLALQLSFLIYAISALWAFGARTARKAWVGLCISATAALFIWFILRN